MQTVLHTIHFLIVWCLITLSNSVSFQYRKQKLSNICGSPVNLLPRRQALVGALQVARLPQENARIPSISSVFSNDAKQNKNPFTVLLLSCCLCLLVVFPGALLYFTASIHLPLFFHWSPSLSVRASLQAFPVRSIPLSSACHNVILEHKLVNNGTKQTKSKPSICK